MKRDRLNERIPLYSMSVKHAMMQNYIEQNCIGDSRSNGILQTSFSREGRNKIACYTELSLNKSFDRNFVGKIVNIPVYLFSKLLK